MHFGDRALGCVGMVSMLPDMALVATGMALAFKHAQRAARRDDLLRRGLDRERPVARGDELRRHPAAAGRLLAREQPVRLLDAERARVRRRPGRAGRRPTASPGSKVDGNDVEAVFEAARDAVERAREGGGPTLIECQTMRMHGHGAHDDMSYVPPEMFEEWAARDPIERYAERLVADYGFSTGRGRRDPRRGHRLRRRVRREGARLADAGSRAWPRDGVFADELASRSATARRPGRAGATRANGRTRVTRSSTAPSAGRQTQTREMTYLEAISDGLRDEMRRDESVFCLGEDIGAFGGAFKVTDGFIEEFGADRVLDTPLAENADHRRRRRRRGRGAAAGLRDAVRRLHRLRLRPARQRRREAPLPPGDRGPDGGPAALRRRVLGRPVPLPEPRGVVPPGAGAEGGRAGDRGRRQGPAGQRDPRPEPGLLPRAQGALPQRQGRGPGGRARGAARQGAGRPRGRGDDGDRLRLERPPRRCRRQRSSTRTSRCSTCAPSARSTPRRSSPAPARRARC